MSELICQDINIRFEDYALRPEVKRNLELFSIHLPTYYHLIPKLVKYLDAQEFSRAQKYYFKSDANRFIVCRTLLKLILASCTGIKVSEIRVKQNQNNKPYLDLKSSLDFNLSHSKDYALVAVGKSAVGVDLEYLDYSFDFNEILRNSFSHQEIQIILNSNNSIESFFKYWTRKEAIVKATGMGISNFFKEIPVKNGHHIVNPILLGNKIDLQVNSFFLNPKYLATIAYKDVEVSTKEKICYKIPTKIDEVI